MSHGSQRCIYNKHIDSYHSYPRTVQDFSHQGSTSNFTYVWHVWPLHWGVSTQELQMNWQFGVLSVGNFRFFLALRILGCQKHLLSGPRGVIRRVWCFHRRGRWILRAVSCLLQCFGRKGNKVWLIANMTMNKNIDPRFVGRDIFQHFPMISIKRWWMIHWKLDYTLKVEWFVFHYWYIYIFIYLYIYT